MNSLLQNKSILIAGGTTGLGLAAAQACSRAGASVTLLSRSEDNCRQASNSLAGPSSWLAADACEPGVAEQAIQKAIDEFGCLDGLCHVAGGSGRSAGDGPLHELTDDGWQFTLRWNLDSVFRSNRAATQYWLEHERPGSVVNIGSVLANRPAPEFFATHAYATAKAGLLGLSQSAAAKYAPAHIRFNVVAPALVVTPLSKRACGDPSIMRYVDARQPMGGLTQPDDVSGAIVFLLSDQARAVTGQELKVDAGWSVSDAFPSTE